MTAFTFAKIFLLHRAQVLVTKVNIEKDNLPGLQVMTIYKEKTLVVKYAFGELHTREEFFELYSEKHAEDFITVYGDKSIVQ